MITTIPTVDTQKINRKETKHATKENYQTTQEETKRTEKNYKNNQKTSNKMAASTWSERVSHSVCPTLSDPMDWSLPGSSVHGIIQARILEWVAIPFSRGWSWPKDQTQVSHIAVILYRITFNVHELNAPIERHRLGEWMKKTSSICCLQETHLRVKDTKRLKMKKMEKDIPCK